MTEEPPAGTRDDGPDRSELVTDDPSDDPSGMEDLITDLDDLAAGAATEETRTEVRETGDLLEAARGRGLIESDRRDLQVSDAAEAFVGSVVFAAPLLVEGGVFEVATHLMTFFRFGVPVFLVANTAFVVLMTYALVEWTGRNREETALLFGRFPVRVLMILGVSFLVATILMTVWGRVGEWQQPTEALARINVIWTVGSLGAALGDILSFDNEPAAGPDADERRTSRVGGDLIEAEHLTDSALVVALHEQFDELEAAVATAADRRKVQQLRHEAVQSALNGALGDRIQKYTARDIAEWFVGSIFFSVPFLVEDGVFEVADFFLTFRVASFRIFFLVNVAFVLLMVSALVYWTGPQEVYVSRPILGIVPRRLFGIAVVSFLTAAALMTMWGRVGNWADPVVALARISVVWTVASFGAALGDVLPGESSGEDINDELTAFGDLFEEWTEGTDDGP